MENREKRQIEWGISLFRIFVLLAARRGALNPEEATELQQEIETLSQRESGQVEKLNALIKTANSYMKSHNHPTEYAPFPSFSIGIDRVAVLDQCDMIERTLVEAAHANLLDWDSEGGFFMEILKLFVSVEQGKVEPAVAMASLAGEIEKINSTLPSEFQLPALDLTAYEVAV